MRNIVRQPVRGSDFFVRQKLIRKLRKDLEANIPIFISGPARSGKTSTLLFLLDTLPGHYNFFYIQVGSITDMKGYYDQILAKLKGEDIQNQNTFANIFNKVLLGTYSPQDEIIRVLSKDEGATPKVIMIDDFSGVLENIRKNEGTEAAVHFLAVDREFRSNLENSIINARLIYTSAMDLEAIANILNAGQLIGDLASFRLQALTDEDAEEFIKKLTLDKEFKLKSSHLRYICQKIQWLYPFHIQLLFYELNSIYLNKDLSEITTFTIDEALERVAMNNPDYFEDWNKQIHIEEVEIEKKKELKKIKIQRIKIKHIKCFEDVEIGFSPSANTSLIIGTNGKGKSTILQLIALGLSGITSVPREYNWKEVVKKNHDRGFFEIDVLYDNTPIHLKYEIESKDDSVTCTEGNDHLQSLRNTFLLLAYGVNRSIKLEETKPYKYFEPIATLFGENGYLKHIKISSTYVYVSSNFEIIKALINKVLEKANGDEKVILTKHDDTSFYFETPSNPKDAIPTEALSEGFKSTLVWLFDAIIRIVEKGGSLANASDITGIILLDEIDLHLHPTWQRTILHSVETLFPNIQFIVTSHSPFVVQSANKECLIALEMERGSDNVIAVDKDITSELSISAIVREIFKISFPFSREIEQKMDKFREMAKALRDNKPIDEKKFKNLVIEIAGKGVELEGVMRRELMTLQRKTGKTFDLWKK